MSDLHDEAPPGIALVNVAFAGTGVVVGTAIAAAILPDAFGLVHAAVSCLLFAVGTGALLCAYALGVARSREDAVTISGLFFLSGGVAPDDVRRPMRIALAVQVVAVVAAAAVRPYSDVAFGILAPMYGLGLMAMWGGRHGVFASKVRT